MRDKIITIIFFVFVIVVSITTRVDIASATEATNYDIQVTYSQTKARSILPYVNELRTGDDAWYWDSDDTTKVVCSELSELEYDYELEKIAMQRAAEIAVSYSHTRPNAESFFTIHGDYSYSYSRAGVYLGVGENIAAGYPSAKSVFIGWRESNATYLGQGHRRNMLNSGFNRIGIGCVTYGGVKYWAMELAHSSVVNSVTKAVDTTETRTIEVSSDMIKKEDVQISTSSYELVVGDTAELPIVTKEITLVDAWPSQNSITLTDTGTWDSADSDILTVTDGKLHAIASGKTTISATVYDHDFNVNVTIYNISKVRGLRIKAKKGKKIVVGYKSASGVDGYRIQIARNKKFTKGKKTKLTKKTKCKIKKLKKGKTYYVRVQAYKVVDGVKKYGKWSVVKKIEVKR